MKARIFDRRLLAAHQLTRGFERQPHQSHFVFGALSITSVNSASREGCLRGHLLEFAFSHSCSIKLVDKYRLQGIIVNQ